MASIICVQFILVPNKEPLHYIIGHHRLTSAFPTTKLTPDHHPGNLLCCLAMSQEHAAGADNPQSSEIVMGSVLSLARSEIGMSYANPLKRRASSSFEGLEQDASRKRLKEQRAEVSTHVISDEGTLMPQGSDFADDLAEELNCGCCSSICFRPVVVSPCQHFFCGRYVILLY